MVSHPPCQFCLKPPPPPVLFSKLHSRTRANTTATLQFQVTFESSDSAAAAVKDPNPVIDGRTTNCNLAAAGAKRRDGRDSRGGGGGYNNNNNSNNNNRRRGGGGGRRYNNYDRDDFGRGRRNSGGNGYGGGYRNNGRGYGRHGRDDYDDGGGGSGGGGGGGGGGGYVFSSLGWEACEVFFFWVCGRIVVAYWYMLPHSHGSSLLLHSGAGTMHRPDTANNRWVKVSPVHASSSAAILCNT